jgi:Transglycosylase SLT domain/Peptidase family M23
VIRRKLFVGLTAVGLFIAGFGIATFPAIADLRVITITLKGGQKVTTTVDVPPGTPLDQIQLPEVTAPITGVEEAKPESKSDQGGAAEPKHEDSTSGRTDKERKTASKHEGISESEAQPQDQAKEEEEKPSGSDIRRPDGVPTARNPTLSVSLPGPAPVGVPNFVINKFRIPPFLLPIYQAAGVQYGIRWEVLAAINEIETDYGRNLNVSSAGALGWMQFIPSSWRTYGVDANQDGQKDPYNPVDAIFAAGRYLKAAGGEKDLRRAIFAYNHADWYVDSVLMRARLIAGMPADVIGSVTGMTQGHFPVHAEARYADDLRERDAKRLGKKVRRAHNAAKIIAPNAKRRSINIYSRRGAPVIAVNDGVVKKIGNNKRLGRFIVLQDVYGNRYTYAHLGEVSKHYPVPRNTDDEPAKQDEFKTAQDLREQGPKLPKPDSPASAGRQLASGDPSGTDAYAQADATVASRGAGKERLFADPSRAGNKDVAEARGQLQQEQLGRSDYQVFKVYFSRVFRLSPSDVKLKPLKKGAKVIGGTVLGKIGKLREGTGSRLAPHLNFSIRPAGRGAPRIDPKPILDGWRLLEATALYRAAGRNPFSGPDADQPSTGQILLMSKEALERRVLANPHIEIYQCGRDNIRAGEVDRRVLATLEYLVASGLSPTVTSLKCGHGHLTASGNVSEHSSGNAVDISKVNDIPIQGHQEPGSITDTTVRKLMALQGVMQPHQIISLIDMGPPTVAMADHADHIHVGFKPQLGPNARLGRAARRLLSNNQWDRLVTRLGDIDNPVVRSRPSKYSIKVRRPHRASRAHKGE